MKRRLIPLALPALAVITLSIAPLGAQDLPIMTWHGPGKDLVSPEMMKTIAAAGFNVNMSFLGDRETNLKALEWARRAGIKLMVHDDRVSKLVEDAALPLDILAAVAADYKSHPAFYGYYVTDEPNASKFARLAAIVARLRAEDPVHPAYVNLFPTYANRTQLGTETYDQHVVAYLDTVKPAFLSYDHYCVTSQGLRPDYFRNLEIIRREALARGLPFWAFTLSVAHAVYLPPTEGHIRFQLFSDLAYGAKGLQYFTFATPIGTDYDWKPALVDLKGATTPVYPTAAAVNREIRSQAALLLRWTSQAVFHSAPLPEGTSPLPTDGLVRAARNAPLVVGQFKDGRDDLIMIVNRDYESARLAVLELSPDVRGLREAPLGDRSPLRLAWTPGDATKTAAFLLAPGDARILRIVR